MERKKASDFPQELLNLFDRYVHGDIARRDFLDGAKKFATGGLTVAAIFESLRPNYAWAEQVPKDDSRIKTEYVTVPSPEGNGSIKGYLVRPASGGKQPGVLVVHENRGLNPYIEDVARRLGTANFIAFAPDGLTSVGGYPGDDEKGAKIFRTGGPGRRCSRIFSLRRSGSRRGPTAPAKSAWWVSVSAEASPINWRSTWDRISPPRFLSMARNPWPRTSPKSRRRCLLQYAGLDTRIDDGWPAYEEALKANHVTYTAYIYPNVNHGFHNDTTPRYDEAAAKLAWSRTLDFFNKYLRG